MATILSTPLEARAEAPLSARRNAASLPASLPASQKQTERRRFARLIVYGLLWAVIVIGLEVPLLGFDEGGHGQLQQIRFHMATVWSITGGAVSIAIFWSTIGQVRWLRLAVSIPIVAIGCATLSAPAMLLARWIFGFSAVESFFGQSSRLLPFFAYHAWLTLIYGGFAAIIYPLRRKIDQTTATLRGTELARERNEAAIAEARVRALVERIEPRFLIDVMTAARNQYRVAPTQAEATLNACVAFLRAAMPQLRSGHSTVAAELELAEAYLVLRDRIDCGIDRGIDTHKRDWHVDRQAASACAIDLARVQLPPMVLCRCSNACAVH